MGSKNNPGKFDCYANAADDEPMFVLLARDPIAPTLVDDWAAERQARIVLREFPQSDMAKVEEARDCASKMREWHKANAKH